MKCLKDYKHHGSMYLAGNEYDVDAKTADEHEAYFGEKLWEKKERKTRKTKKK